VERVRERKSFLDLARERQKQLHAEIGETSKVEQQ
jgi:hypothetical protein